MRFARTNDYKSLEKKQENRTRVFDDEQTSFENTPKTRVFIPYLSRVTYIS